MKPLVPAWYAQCWVGAGGKHAPRACGLRAISNGMVTPTLFSWRPVLVHSRTPLWYSPSCVRSRLGTCNAVHRAFGSVTLCADVACLAWVWRMRGQAAFAPAGAIGGPLLFETMAAKEAKETVRLRWKSPRLFIGEAKKGLQCGLSGNRVARMGNAAPQHRRGNRLYRQREVCCGENQPVPKP